MQLPSAPQVLVQPTDGPRFCNVKKPEQSKRPQNPIDSVREEAKGNPHPDEFVPDNAAMVVNLQVSSGLAAEPDTYDKSSQS